VKKENPTGRNFDRVLGADLTVVVVVVVVFVLLHLALDAVVLQLAEEVLGTVRLVLGFFPEVPNQRRVLDLHLLSLREHRVEISVGSNEQL